MNKGNFVGVVYLDLSKAFDTIGHAQLLNKLSAYGVRGKELQWFASYLFQRTQVVALGHINSESECVNCGVPQGSILGPLLFITFFNDLVDILDSKVIMYADDTVIYCASDDVNVVENVLNSEMKAVGSYCSDNELFLNLKMLFGTARRLSKNGRKLKIYYNGSIISCVKEYEYLGNVLDSSLNLNTNFNQAYKRASSRMRLLQNVRSYLTTHAATNIYTLMIHPILTYAGPVKSTYTKTQMDKLVSLHLRAKCITGNNHLNCITNVIQRQICLLVKKCLEKQTNSQIFDNYFCMQSHERATRSNNTLIEIPLLKLEVAKQRFYVAGAKIFNSLPIEIRLTKDIKTFRSLIFDHFQS